MLGNFLFVQTPSRLPTCLHNRYNYICFSMWRILLCSDVQHTTGSKTRIDQKRCYSGEVKLKLCKQLLSTATMQKDHARSIFTPFSSQPLECFNCTQGVWSSAWVMQRTTKEYDKKSTKNYQTQNILSRVKICNYPAESWDAQISNV